MKNTKINNKGKNYTKGRIFTLFALVLTVGFFLYQLENTTLAEQSDSSPESGVTSRIKTIYDSLVSLSHGSESAGGWGDWGALWNRIRSAGEWVPTGDAIEADVASGKTFYNTNRTQKTGNASLAPDWSTFSKVTWDDYNNGGSADGDNAGEESVWTNTAGSATTGVWKDTRTGLYWSSSQGSSTNLFTVASCDYFSSTPRGSYEGGDNDCGNAINYCATLNLTSGGTSNTDWYLPSQKELMIAYIDGIYNQTNTSFVTTSYFWTPTELSDEPNYAWYVNLRYGNMYNDTKDYGAPSVRCVRRD